jgi:hypothetical protein
MYFSLYSILLYSVCSSGYYVLYPVITMSIINTAPADTTAVTPSAPSASPSARPHTQTARTAILQSISHTASSSSAAAINSSTFPQVAQQEENLYIKLPKCWGALGEEREGIVGWIEAYDDEQTGKWSVSCIYHYLQSLNRTSTMVWLPLHDWECGW